MRTILITGATGKLGKELALQFLSSGHKVILVGRSVESIKQEVLRVCDDGKKFLLLEADLLSDFGIRNIVKDAHEAGFCITHLINSARSLDSLKVDDDGNSSNKNFIDEFHLQVVVPYQLASAILESPNHQLSNIVSLGSMYGEVAPTPFLYEGSLKNSPIQYGTVKAALHHLTRELAVRFGPRNVRVNCVAFGGFSGRENDAFVKRYSYLTPSRRMLSTNEVLGPVDFLQSESSSSVNGHVLIADGGWSIM